MSSESEAEPSTGGRTSDRPAFALDDSEADRSVLLRVYHRLRLPILSFSTLDELLGELDRRENLHVDELPLYLLLDLSMPDVDGLSVLQVLGARHPTLPAVVLSGSARSGERDAAYRLGASGVIEKPLGVAAWTELARGLDHYWRHVAQPVGRLR